MCRRRVVNVRAFEMIKTYVRLNIENKGTC